MKEFSITVKAEQLGVDLKKFSDGMIEAIREGIENIAESTYSKIRETAAKALANKSYNETYLKALSFKKLNKNSWILELHGDFANKIEEGTPAFDMRDILLKSKAKVSAGPRAGTSWVQTSKAGYKYANVPVQKFVTPPSADMATMLKSLQATGRNGVKQTINKIFRNIQTGEPLQGRVAVAGKQADILANKFEGLTKYQTTKNNRTYNLYMLYRGISNNPEKSKGWRNPGIPAVNAWKGLDNFIDQQFAILLKEIEEE